MDILEELIGPLALHSSSEFPLALHVVPEIVGVIGVAPQEGGAVVVYLHDVLQFLEGKGGFLGLVLSLDLHVFHQLLQETPGELQVLLGYLQEEGFLGDLALALRVAVQEH